MPWLHDTNFIIHYTFDHLATSKLIQRLYVGYLTDMGKMPNNYLMIGI